MPGQITIEMLDNMYKEVMEMKVDPIEVAFNERTLIGPYAPRFDRLIVPIRKASIYMGRSLTPERHDAYIPENIVIIHTPLDWKSQQCSHGLSPAEMNIYHSSGMCMTAGLKIINLANEAQWASVTAELDQWDQMWERIGRITVDTKSFQG